MLPRNPEEPDSSVSSPCPPRILLMCHVKHASRPFSSFSVPPSHGQACTVVTLLQEVPLCRHPHVPRDSSALVSLGRFAARGSIQCASVNGAPVTSPPSLPRWPCPPRLCAAALPVDTALFFTGALPLGDRLAFPQDSAHASLGGILSKSALTLHHCPAVLT